MFGINGAEFVVLLLVAVVVIGPERLPRYAEQLGSFVRSAKVFLKDARSRVDEEIKGQVGDVDWSMLDPRQYDPRRIVREALLDDNEDDVGRYMAPPPPAPPRADEPADGPVDAPTPVHAEAAAPAAGRPGVPVSAPVSLPAPYDDEAT